jgi:glutamate-1-semialdehyde 2,1-aminomutase
LSAAEPRDLPTRDADQIRYRQSEALRAKAHRLIPGGAHTYAKGDDQFPVLSPGFMVRGKGCRAWDVDGNEFVEYGMGLRSVTLGHAYAPVLDAAYRQMQLGANFTRPSPLEAECAEALLNLTRGGEMVKFTKDGSTATSAAIRLARAYTGRDMIGLCIDHPFFSYDDWAIAVTPMRAGIPQAVQDLTVGFRYNDLGSVQALFDQHPERIAGLIMEPAKDCDPENGFLHAVRDLCHRNGAVFILDEMITGFRWPEITGQRLYDVEPDLSTFGKGIANGFALAALVGKREIMKLGGLDHDQERAFILSTTHGAETHALAAALAVVEIYRREPVVEVMDQQGQRLARGVNQMIDRHGLGGYFEVLGRASNLVYATRDETKKPSQPFRTLFMQETIRRGLILPSLVISYSHTDDDVDITIEAIGEALGVYRQALENGVDNYLVGRPVQPVFQRYGNLKHIQRDRRGYLVDAPPQCSTAKTLFGPLHYDVAEDRVYTDHDEKTRPETSVSNSHQLPGSSGS